jgi:TRAP-type uncharacterized transport system substrate-binding protein
MSHDVHNHRLWKALSAFTETFGLSRAAATGLILFVGAVVIVAVFWFIASAPPRTLIITSGPPASSFQRTAERYRDILSSNGVKVKILPSQGSIENLQRLADPAYRVDVGFASF